MVQKFAVSSDDWEDVFIRSTEALFVADGGGTLFRWSDALGEIVGHTLSRGASLAELVHVNDRVPLTTALGRLRSEPGVAQVSCRVLSASRLFEPFVCVLRRAARGDLVYGSLRREHVDAQGSNSVDERARRLGRMLGVLTDNLPVLVWAIDEEGTFSYYDGKALNAAGLERNQFVGQNLFEVYRSRPAEIEDVRRALRGALVHTLSEVHGVYWENWMVPLRDADGNVESVVGMSLDVSEAKRAERELRLRLEEIEKQQRIIRELSIPIIQVWDGVLALPMVGVVDSARTSDVMQNLLDEIIRTGARYAILDLTGVEVVDTGVANHLIALINAIQLLGAGGIICGIQPTVAQTMVALGMDLTGVVTRANLKAAIMFCIDRMRKTDGGARPAPRPAAP